MLTGHVYTVWTTRGVATTRVTARQAIDAAKQWSNRLGVLTTVVRPDGTELWASNGRPVGSVHDITHATVAS